MWVSDFKLQEGEKLICLLCLKGSILLEIRALSKRDGLLIILSSEERLMLINCHIFSKNSLWRHLKTFGRADDEAEEVDI